VKKRYVVLIFLASLGVITFLDRLAIAVAGPRMQRDLQIPIEKWGWVLGAFVLGYGIFEIPTGALGDRYGQRSVLTRIVSWWSAFTALTGAVQGFFVLCLTRFLFGAGEAGAYPNASGVIARWFPLHERARAQSVVWAASRLGGALAPLTLVPLQATIGWRWCFLVLGCLGLTWVLAWRWWYHDDPRQQPGMTQEEIDEITRGASPQSHCKIPWSVLFRHRQVWLIVAMYWCYVWGSWFYFTWFPTYLVAGAGFTEAEMGLFGTLPFLLGVAGNLAGGQVSDWLVKRYGLRIGRCAPAGAALATSSLLVLALAFSQNKTAVVMLSAMGFGVMDFMLPATWSICLDLGSRWAGTLTGIMNTSGQLSGFACTVLFGYLVSYTGSYRIPLVLVSLMLMISTVLFSQIDPRHPIVAGEEARAPKEARV